MRFEQVREEKLMRHEHNLLKTIGEDLKHCTFEPYLFKAKTLKEPPEKIPVRGLQGFLMRNKNAYNQRSFSNDKLEASRTESVYIATHDADVKSRYAIENNYIQCNQQIK